jgi:hypothetical protein
MPQTPLRRCRCFKIGKKPANPEIAIPDPGKSAGFLRDVESSQIHFIADRDGGFLEGVRKTRLPS